MKKILFVIHDLHHGGAEKVLVNLVNNMDKTKFDVTVMSLFDVGVNRQFLNKDVKYKYCFKKMRKGNNQLMKLVSPKRLYQMLIKDEYDVLVSYLEGPTARIISGAPINKKKICWIHVAMSTKQIIRPFRNYKEAKGCYKKMDFIVFVSEGVRESFKESITNFNDSGVLYNTNETEEIIEKSYEQLNSDKLMLFNEDELKFCFIGKVLKNKGIYRLAQAHIQLRKAGYPVHTYILGQGEEIENIKQLILQHGYENSFTFLGYQTNPYKYIAKCDWFVCASYAEGFSTAATEALIVGKPVLTTRVAGMEEMLGSNNEYGIIVENDDRTLYEGMRNILDNPELTTIYTIKAKERGTFFSKEKTVEAVERLLLYI